MWDPTLTLPRWMMYTHAILHVTKPMTTDIPAIDIHKELFGSCYFAHINSSGFHPIRKRLLVGEKCLRKGADMVPIMQQQYPPSVLEAQLPRIISGVDFPFPKPWDYLCDCYKFGGGEAPLNVPVTEVLQQDTKLTLVDYQAWMKTHTLLNKDKNKNST